MKSKSKRFFAACLSIIFILSIGVCAENNTFSIAASKPTITSKVTIVRGDKKYLEVKPNGFTITRIMPKSSDTSVVSVKNNNNRVQITAKDKGTAIITTKIRARKGKKTQTFKLKTKVTVKIEKVTSMTVTTFEEMKSALASMQKAGGSVTINSAETGAFEIPSGSYGKVDLIVNTPTAEITNSATFKSITIQSMKAEKWLEKAKGNIFNIDSTNAVKLVIDMGASVKSIVFNGTVSSAVQTVDVVGTLEYAKVDNIAPAQINAPAAPSSISLIEVTAKGAKLGVDINIGSTVSKIRALTSCNVNLTGTSTSIINVEKVDVASVSTATTLTGVSTTIIPA